MMTTLEQELGIVTVQAAIGAFQDKYPGAHLTKLQLEYNGPFLKYDMVGFDDQHRYNYEFNAVTQKTLKDKAKPLKPKQVEKMNRKILNLENLKTLREVTDIALDRVPVTKPFEWELERKGERTLWEIEIVDESGDQVHEVKVDAQDGTVTQVKLDG